MLIAAALMTSISASAVAAGDPVIAAAGDIACDPLDPHFNAGSGATSECRQLYTSDLIQGAAPAAVLPLGDVQYYCGGYNAFLQSYDLSWGRSKAISHPVVGNHEYLTTGGTIFGGTDCNANNAGAAGYFDYWNGVGNTAGPAGDRGRGFYSYDVGTWHLIALNSSCGSSGGCGATSPQGKFLKADLAAHPNKCTLAYWHIPRFSSGGRASTSTGPFWDQLYAAGADVVLTAHDHLYERFAPQRPDGTADATTGIREFVVGTGGANHTSVATIAANSEVRNDQTYGVLMLTLHNGSYDWQFAPEPGASFTDSGTGQCHGGDIAAPSVPSNLTGNAFSKTQVDLGWGASTDNIGVTGYTIYRDGAAIATVGPGTLSYRDETAQPSTNYSYTVDAFDAEGNHSAKSNAVAVKTPGASSKTFVPVADTYVDSKKSKSNFGKELRLATGVAPPADVSSYARFDVRGLEVNVTSAKLRILPTKDNATGFKLFTVADNLWGETTTTFANKPALGAQVGFSGPFKAGTWQEIDVTSLVKADGLFSFGITSTDLKATDYASREAGATAPELVVTSEPEKIAPSTPTLTSAAPVTASRVDLSWTGSTDNVGVAGYTVYRNGNAVASVGPDALSYSDRGLSPGTAYTYTVDAVDAALNRSAQSNAITATTPALSTITFTPVADNYVDASTPTLAAGTANVLRTDASPDVHSYLRFDLADLGPSVVSAKLRVYANSANPIGYEVHGVSDNSWGETSTTYETQPAVGSLVRSSGPLTAGAWTEVDVTPLVTGSGPVSLALTSTSATAATYASRETGATAPQLLVTTEADTQAPSAPTLTDASASGPGQVNLAWTASTDDRSVKGYTVYRDGAALADVPAGTLAYSDGTVAADTTYSYTVDAFDRAGNRSAVSNSIAATTPAIIPTATLSFVPVADTYVDAGNPAGSFGSSLALRTDASPDVHGYLRFDLSGLGATIVSAKLRVYANTGNTIGYDVRGVGDNLWGETTTNYGNQPAMGPVVGSSGRVTAATWSEVDVTPLVTGNGLLSLAMTSTSATGTSFASRESGANAPVLVVQNY